MGWFDDIFRGGSEELGWDDLVRKIAGEIAKLARYGERGRVAFPPDVTVRIEVGEGGVAVIRGFVDKPELDAQVGAAIANACDCEASVLPAREYDVVASEKTRITVKEGSPRVWELEIDGGDLGGRVVALPPGRREARFGRGEWHGGDQHTRNDVIVCEKTEFVSRRAGRIMHVGHHLEIESLDQGDALVVRRASGETIRPARTAKGRTAVSAGDVVELGDARGGIVRLVVRRVKREEQDGGDHA